jgi:hypothetical protein
MKQLKYTITLMWITAIISSEIDELFGPVLMDETAYDLYLKQRDYPHWSLSLADSALLTVLFIGSILIYVGKIRYFPCFVIGFIGLNLLTAFGGTVVSSGVSELMFSLSLIMGGMAVVIGYKHYKQTKAVD